MKKRNVLALALALVMSVGMSSSVFAATWDKPQRKMMSRRLPTTS